MKKLYILRQVDMFEDLNPSSVKRLLDICTEKRYTQGEVIYEIHSPAQEFYIILHGEVEVLLTASREEKELSDNRSVLRGGQVIGETALVDQGLRITTARCRSKTCELLQFERQQFITFLQQDYEIGMTIMRNLAAHLAFKMRQVNFRMQDSMTNQSESASVITV